VIACSSRAADIVDAPGEMDETAFAATLREVVRIVRDAQAIVPGADTKNRLGEAAKTALNAGVAYKNGPRSNAARSVVLESLTQVLTALTAVC